MAGGLWGAGGREFEDGVNNNDDDDGGGGGGDDGICNTSSITTAQNLRGYE
jgi:hypothetical protein